MDNEKIIEDFFRNFRVTLTNASSYSKNHPYFIKSVGDFKLKLDSTLSVINPLRIGVTSFALVVADKTLNKAGLYDELARLLHQRKIKSIEIRSGVSLEELIKFFSVISLPQKDVFKGGGVNAILKDKGLAHFTIEELDYSVFLHGEGKECNDIWGYMLAEAARSNDTEKINRMADDFGPFMAHASENDILGSEEIPADINEFLSSLKEKNKEKFGKCSKDVFSWLLHNKKSLNSEKLAKLKPVFNSLDDADFSDLLWDGLLQDDSFDALSLELFSKISEHKNSPKIADGIFNKITESQQLMNNPKVAKRIQNLLTSSQGDQLSAVYRNTLESLVKEISSNGLLFFDQKLLRSNYRYIILNILAINNEDESILKLASGALEKELPHILDDNDFEFLKQIRQLLAKKKAEGVKACIDLEKKISAFIESAALNQGFSPDQDFLLEMVTYPSQDGVYYLDRIFSGEKIRKPALILFFRLYASSFDIFYKRLEQKIQDMDFLSGLVDSLGQIDTVQTLSVLEHIYSLTNQLIKLKVLEAMGQLKKVDAGFLMAQLNTDSSLLRKNLLAVLMLDTKIKQEVLDSLFKIPNPWGSKNKLLIENMQIVYDLKFKDAVGCIQELSRRRFFWNSQLRSKAKQILKEWNVC